MYDKLFAAREEKLLYYSSTHFLKKISRESQLKFLKKQFSAYTGEGDKNNFSIHVEVDGHHFIFLVGYLAWDTDFFKMKTHRLLSVIFEPTDYYTLTRAIAKFYKTLVTNYENEFLFIEVPSEDNILIQALCTNSFRLVESRLTYFIEMKNYVFDKRHPTRIAQIEDIPNLREVAAKAYNLYDRFHSDIAYSREQADAFLSKYAEESVKGLCDFVVVPNVDKEKPDAFGCLKYLKDELNEFNCNILKGVLAAINPETRKGWYLKMMAETIGISKEKGAEYFLAQTQTANREVVRVWEWLGLLYGCTSHIFSIKKEA